MKNYAVKLDSYSKVMNDIPDGVLVLISWLEMIFRTLLEFLGIIKDSDHSGPIEELPEA